MLMADPVVAEPGADVRFGVLGPLKAVAGAGDIRAVSAAKQRVVLAALLLSGGRMVSAAGLAEALWDASPPPNAQAAMRTYVMRLRRALGPAGARIIGGPSGWAVELRRPEELDLDEVDHLRRAARASAEAGQWRQVSSLLTSALGLWRGEPLIDVPSAALARREAPRLAELWLQLTEARIDADLRVGSHGEVVAELQRLAAEHPLREHIRAQLMLAYYRCGNQAAALAAYRDARRTLDEELGVEPGRELHEMHQKILAADPDLTPSSVVPQRGVPSQRPADLHLVTGPAEQIKVRHRSAAMFREIPKHPGDILGGMVRHLTVDQYADGYATRPAVDDSDVAMLIPVAVTYVFDLADTWMGWDGCPIYRDGNAWTPHKALRRVSDHLVDHLAEIECRLAGKPTLPDRWHGRMITTAADFARFTEVDLDEATSRLTRLAACYQARLGSLAPQVLDARPDDAVWTIREVAHHVSHVTEYADMVGHLGRSRGC